MGRVQYTIRNVPAEVDRALRLKARKSHESLNEVLLQALRTSVSADDGLVKYHDLDFIAGSWADDAGTNSTLKDQRKIDAELWK